MPLALRKPLWPAALVAFACLGAIAPGSSVIGADVAVAATTSMEEVAVLTTPQGEIAWRFFDKDAPNHAAYVKELIRRGFYDGTTFHRVIPHFVVQGGDPNSKNTDRSDDGEGEADRRLKAEFSTTLHYRPGTVGMARDADPDSGSCQYFIALENIPRLDGRYTIFGEVISGLDVARRIADLPRDQNDNPLERVTVTARIEKRPVATTIVSMQAGESGEILTGPDKPKFFDPRNILWRPPVLQTSAAGASASSSVARLDLALSAEGKVIDVRFVDPATPDAGRLRDRALGWRFTPATYDGKAVKARIEIDAAGGRVGPPLGGGAPTEIGAGVTAPQVAVRVELPAGNKAPEKPPHIRLTIDPSGTVTEAALQSSCGDPALDATAVEGARKLVFEPATKIRVGRKEPDPIAVYLDVEARFVEAAK